MASKDQNYVLPGLLSKLLQQHQVISVSFLNSQFKGKAMPFCITFEFLKQFPDFIIAVIGGDLKISQNDVNKYAKTFDENSQFYTDLHQILVKDANTASSLKKKLINTSGVAPLSTLQDKWSSNKYKYNLPFVVRNSHKFILFIQNDKSFVKERTGRDIQLDATGIWAIVEKNVKGLVSFCLKSLLCNVDYPVNQGTLQACIDYGFAAIDKSFMGENEHTFVGGGEPGVALKGSKAASKIDTSNSYTTNSTGYTTNSTGYTTKANTEAFTTKANAKGFTTHDEAPASSGASSQRPAASASSQKKNGSGELRSHLPQIEEAYSNQQTVVLLGNGVCAPLFLADSRHSNAKQLEMLTALKSQIESEICMKTFAR